MQSNNIRAAADVMTMTTIMTAPVMRLLLQSPQHLRCTGQGDDGDCDDTMHVRMNELDDSDDDRPTSEGLQPIR